MKDIIARLIFVLWIVSGMLFFGFAIAGLDDLAAYSGAGFLSPIILGLVYITIKWIITGNTD